MTAFFTSELLHWHAATPRPLPWKDTTDPYIIWLSEIILQQTRVEQGLPYFLKFRSRYPTVFDLAKAPIDQVLKDWEGLGYYSRARNLHYTAKHVATQLGGTFPDTYEGLLGLKGVGAYTAAAIASFAYGLPKAVVDGNVKRVLSRFFGIQDPVDETATQNQLQRLADELIPESAPADFNQAIMNFGALQCVPKNPDCPNCPLATECLALQKGLVRELPRKKPKKPHRSRVFNYIVLHDKAMQTAIGKRGGKDIWKGLYEYPLWESDAPPALGGLLQHASWLLEAGAVFKGKTAPYQQTLSHQKITAFFWHFDVSDMEISHLAAFLIIPVQELKNYPFPRIIDWYLSDKSLNLELF